MNSTKFKFVGKFYKHKFSTPICSVISPILAEIVMKDLDKCILERLRFVFLFCFQYVNNILLCVLLGKLQTVVDNFKDHYPRIQFTYDK